MDGLNATTAMAAEGNERAPLRVDWPIEGVALITLSRPDVLNTLTNEMIKGFATAIEEVNAARARVVIITGTEKAFCCGAYVRYFTDPASPYFDDPMAIRDVYVRPMVDLFRSLQHASFVTIAAINGYALGGGCELALACDFRLMAANAQIGLTEARLGAVAGATGIQMLSGLLGRARALEVALLADKWPASDALRIGLVNAVYEAEALRDSAIALARRLLLCSPSSVKLTKQGIYRAESVSPEEADHLALDAVALAASAPDWKEGMAAFTERRAPSFARNGVAGNAAGLP